jgi:uncharacterized cupin superfamily protein
MPKRVVNLADLEFRPWGRGAAPPGAGTPADGYEARIGAVGARVGLEKLGCNVTVVPAGRKAYPFHNHRVNEEMFIVLEGEGEVRIGAERFPIRAGDVIACPAGGPETAHQILNTSGGELRYLAISTRQYPEIAEYPDTGRFGVYGEWTGPDGKPSGLRFMGRRDMGLPYWDGE